MTATGRQLPEPGDIVAGKYRVERVLGAGGMGAVFEATHQVTGKRFAVKWLLPDLSGHAEAVKRFIREAQVAGRFEHPNVVEIYDVGEERGSFFMVMELLLGESLAQYLRSRARLSPSEACTLLIPCMRGVSCAHRAGIVHRDLKPDNIFVCSDGVHPVVPKVLDFGISKMANLAGDVSPSITKTGIVMGTPHYMAPEQIRGKDLDHRVDVYAFGVILYQALSGWLPFPGDTYSELVLKIATEEPKPLAEHDPSLPRALIDIVSRAMSRDPNARYQTVDELADALVPFASPGFVAHAASGAAAPLSLTPRPGSGGHIRKATPSSGTIPLETPLSTQSSPPHLQPARSGPPWLVIGLSVVAAAVVALVIVALVLLNREPQIASEPVEPEASPDHTAAALPKRESPAPPADAPVVNTVRIAPDAPQPERRWEPPPAVAKPEPSPAVKAPEPEPEPERVATKPGKRSKKKPGSEEHLRVPPSPPTPAQAQAPAKEPPATSNKPSPGRLGVHMEATEF